MRINVWYLKLLRIKRDHQWQEQGEKRGSMWLILGVLQVRQENKEKQAKVNESAS